MIEVSDLFAGYGRIRVLGGVSFRVGAGECVGILGHNGMGKSTLLKTIVGLLPHSSGSIRFEGRTIEHAPEHARARLGIGYVPQGRLIFPGLRVRENLGFAMAAGSGGAKDAVDSVLQDFPELVRLLDRSGSTLSGGEQRLLAIARALRRQPKLLLGKGFNHRSSQPLLNALTISGGSGA